MATVSAAAPAIAGGLGLGLGMAGPPLRRRQQRPPPLISCACAAQKTQRRVRTVTDPTDTATGTGTGTDTDRLLISSVSNPLVKHCVKLRLSSSFRRANASLLVVGLTPILEICKFHREMEEHPSFYLIEQLLVLQGTSLPQELTDISAPVVPVTANVLKKISGMQSIDATEVIAIMKMPSSFCDLHSHASDAMLYDLLPSPSRLLVLDAIQDPGNFGTLVRSARAFKWDGIFLLPGCCDPFNEKALRAARGASFQLPIISGNWSQLNAFATSRKMKILAGHPANSTNNPKPTPLLTNKVLGELARDALCLALGSEGYGLSSETLEKAELISIPMEGSYESLNVSVAGGIFLFMLQPQNPR